MAGDPSIRRQPDLMDFCRGFGLTLSVHLWLQAVVLWQVIPPGDARHSGARVAGESLNLWRFGVAMLAPLKAFVPLSAIQAGSVHWGQSLFEPTTRGMLALAMLVATLVILLGLASVARSRAAILLYVLGVAGLSTFYFRYQFQSASPRHLGYIVVVWVVAAWIAQRAELSTAGAAARPPSKLLTALALPMVLASVELSVADVLRPFSGAPAAVAAMRRMGADSAAIIALAMPEGTAIAALLDRPVYFPVAQAAGTYAVWGRLHSLDSVALFSARAIDSIRPTHCLILLLSNSDSRLALAIPADARLVFETPGRPMSGEMFRIFTIPTTRPHCTAS